jgi:hypothetical protein
MTPIDILVGFCNRVGANMWINIPTHFTMKDTTMEPTNSVTQLVSHISANLNHDLYLEYGNEVWNSAGSIGNNTAYIQNLGTALGFPSDNNRLFNDPYGMKVVMAEAKARAAWTSLTGNLKMVMAFQAVMPTSGTNTYRFKGTDLAPVASGGQGNSTWNTYTGSANYTAFPNRPIDKADVLAYQNYWSGVQCTNFDANYTSLAASKTITGISQFNPGVITFSADPGYATGQRINITGVVGMTQVNGNNYSLTKLTATTYSMYTDATLGTTVDTTGFTAYSSGGTAKSYPTISGLTSWADQYATGVPATMDTAMSNLDADMEVSTSSYNTTYYPGWETVAAGYDGARPVGKSNLTIELYEGACEAVTPATASCTTLGISTSYNTTIGNLLTAYKGSKYFYSRCRKVNLQFQAASAGRTTTPVWFLFTPTSQWSMGTGSPTNDIYGNTFVSYDVVKHFNTAKRRFYIGT